MEDSFSNTKSKNQNQNQSISEDGEANTLVDQERDNFCIYINQKVRNLNKQLNQIQDLEEKGSLKPQQIEKLNSQGDITQQRDFFNEMKKHYILSQQKALDSVLTSISNNTGSGTLLQSKIESTQFGRQLHRLKDIFIKQLTNLFFAGRFVASRGGRDYIHTTPSLSQILANGREDELNSFVRQSILLRPPPESYESITIQQYMEQCSQELDKYFQQSDQYYQQIKDTVNCLCQDEKFLQIEFEKIDENLDMGDEEEHKDLVQQLPPAVQNQMVSGNSSNISNNNSINNNNNNASNSNSGSSIVNGKEVSNNQNNSITLSPGSRNSNNNSANSGQNQQQQQQQLQQQTQPIGNFVSSNEQPGVNNDYYEAGSENSRNQSELESQDFQNNVGGGSGNTYQKNQNKNVNYKPYLPKQNKNDYDYEEMYYPKSEINQNNLDVGEDGSMEDQKPKAKVKSINQNWHFRPKNQNYKFQFENEKEKSYTSGRSQKYKY